MKILPKQTAEALLKRGFFIYKRSGILRVLLEEINMKLLKTNPLPTLSLCSRHRYLHNHQKT